MIIHYLGNEFIKRDSLAIEIVDEIKEKFEDIDFKKIESFNDLMTLSPEYVMDVCSNIDKVREFTDIDRFLDVNRTSLHDMDFSFFMKLNHKLGNIENINILCVPPERYKDINEDVIEIIERWKK